jgi:ABC-type uncharacterized transport system substrate-binding protein
MSMRIVVSLLAVLILAAYINLADAGQAKVYRVEVIHQGGPYRAVVDGLREGLRQLGYEEGKHFAMEIRDAKGDLKAVETAARNLERDKIDLIYAVSTSVAMVIRGQRRTSQSFSALGVTPSLSGSWTVSRNPEEGSRACTSWRQTLRPNVWRF